MEIYSMYGLARQDMFSFRILNDKPVSLKIAWIGGEASGRKVVYPRVLTSNLLNEMKTLGIDTKIFKQVRHNVYYKALGAYGEFIFSCNAKLSRQVMLGYGYSINVTAVTPVFANFSLTQETYKRSKKAPSKKPLKEILLPKMKECDNLEALLGHLGLMENSGEYLM